MRNRPSIPPRKPSAAEIVRAAYAEYERLQHLLKKAIREDRAGLGRPPGPTVDKDNDLLLWEALCRAVDGREVTRAEMKNLKIRLARKTGIKFSDVPSKKAWQWRSRSRSADQLEWEERWHDGLEASRIVSMIINEGSLSWGSIRRTRGILSWRLRQFIPSIERGVCVKRKSILFDEKAKIFKSLIPGSSELATRIAAENDLAGRSSPAFPSRVQLRRLATLRGNRGRVWVTYRLPS